MDLQENQKKILDELQIKYFISDVFESSDFENGYGCIYIESVDEARKKLISLNFEGVRRNLFVIDIHQLETISEKKIEEAYLILSD